MAEPLSRDELADLIDEGYADKGAWPIPGLIATARLADDMAAVIRRLDDGWTPAGNSWRRPQYLNDTYRQRMTPGEVAALQHARQQEDLIDCPDCGGTGVRIPDVAPCDECGTSGKVPRHARQQEST
jgi:hypothetical protein